MQDPRLPTLTEHRTVGSRLKPRISSPPVWVPGMAPACPTLSGAPVAAARMPSGPSPDPPVGNVQIILRSSFVSLFFADRILPLNSRVRAARQTRLVGTVRMPGLGRGGSGAHN